MSWTFQLCDLQGRAISTLTGVAYDRKFQFRHNRPTSFTARVPSGQGSVNTLHTDGLPYLEQNVRVLKAFREELQPTGNMLGVIRFAGVVFLVQDQSDTDQCFSTFTAYNPLMMLARRLVYDASTPPSSTIVTFTADDISILKTIVERSLAIKGQHGLSTNPALGAAFPAGTPKTMRWERKSVAQASQDLTDPADGFDIELIPLDRQDGILAALKCSEHRGTSKPDIQFAWGLHPFTAKGISHAFDGTVLANDVIGLGQTLSAGDTIAAEVTDTPSIALNGVYEDVVSFPDLATLDAVTAATQTSVNISALAAETIQVTPTLAAPPPWVDPATGEGTWDVGDTFRVAATPEMRKAFDEQRRCYGFDLTLDDEGNESIDALYLAQDASL